MASITFPSSPSNGDTYTYDGLVYEYNSAKNKWSVKSTTVLGGLSADAVGESLVPTANVTYDLGTADKAFRDLYLSGNTINLGGATISASGNKIVLPAGSSVGATEIGTGSGSGGATQYANTAALPKLGMTAGEFAYVGNTLFMTNGSGWYSVALINQTPELTLSTSSIFLGAEGNTVNFTYTSTDPDGPEPTVSMEVFGANTSQANITLHTSNNTVSIENFSAEEFSANIVLTATDGIDQTFGTVSLKVIYIVPTLDFLLVAGGGAGGTTGSSDDRAGGGGAGGLIETFNLLPEGTINVTVGSGGQKVAYNDNVDGADGEDSVLSFANGTIYTALGGGGGGGGRRNGRSGGSGGGGGAAYSNLGNAQFPGGTGLQPNSASGGYGNNGGQGGTDNATYRNGAGGGGAGGPAPNAFAQKGDCDGGLGYESFLTGNSVFYASGGAGDGGEVSPGGGGIQQQDAIPNTGGGGGGASSFSKTGGSGGSGVCVIRSTIEAISTTGASVIASQYVDTGTTYYVYQFNDDGSITFT